MSAAAVQVEREVGPGEGVAGFPVITDRLGLMSIREAVRRLGNCADYTGSRETSALYSVLYRAAQRWDGSPRVGLFEGELHVPAAMHPGLALSPFDSPSSSTLAGLSMKARGRAIAIKQTLDEFATFMLSSTGRTLGLERGRDEFVRQRAGVVTYRADSREYVLTISPRTLARWDQVFRRGGLDALAVDRRGKRKTSIIGPSADAVAMYWALRNDPRRFTASKCHRLVAAEAEKRGWAWFDSVSATRRFDRANRQARGLILCRDGEQAYTAKAGPYIASDPESFQPNECWESDETPANAWVRMPSGEVLRPAVTVWLDWRSRCVVGYCVSVTGNQETILAAFASAARAHGLPERVHCDNGRDYSAYIFNGGRPKRRRQTHDAGFESRAAGVFGMLGVDAHWVLPYTPNAKARVERFFRTLDEDFFKLFPSYCGNCPDNRPEAHAELAAKAVDFAEFEARLGEWINVYNQRPHSGEGMNGRTPLDVLGLAERRRVLTDEQAKFLLAAWPRAIAVQRHGVAIRIAGQTVRYGAFDPALQRLAIGTKVRVAYDPADLSAISVWSLEGRFIARVEQNQRFNRKFTSEGLREALREKRRTMRAMRQVRENGLAALATDPVAAAIAAEARDAERRRKPTPTPPSGGPLLVPVQTDVEAPSTPIPMRAAVGGPEPMGLGDLLVAAGRRAAEERRALQARRGPSQGELLERLAKEGRRP